MRIKLFFVIPLLFGAIEVKSAFNEPGLDLEEINPDKTAVGSAEEEIEDAYEAPEPVLIDENQLETDLDPYENDTDIPEAESGEELEETSDFLEDRRRKTKSKNKDILSYELMIFLGTDRHPSHYKDICRRLRNGKRPKSGKPVRFRKRPRKGKPIRNGNVRVKRKVYNCCRLRNFCLGKLKKSGTCPFKRHGPFDMPYAVRWTEKGKKHFQCGRVRYRMLGRCRNELCKCDTKAVNCFINSEKKRRPNRGKRRPRKKM
ncbi:uncharacterized protein LOC111321323 [Stylophora pistillata]|nr:uncharacterized protein LOC111321323 [Stylophora pistillata]